MKRLLPGGPPAPTGQDCPTPWDLSGFPQLVGEERALHWPPSTGSYRTATPVRDSAIFKQVEQWFVSTGHGYVVSRIEIVKSARQRSLLWNRLTQLEDRRTSAIFNPDVCTTSQKVAAIEQLKAHLSPQLRAIRRQLAGAVR